MYDDCTIEDILKDNLEVLENVQKYHLNYKLIDESYNMEEI